VPGTIISIICSNLLDDADVDLDEREGARTVATCLAAVESAATGCPVAVRNDW
jgi:hypothetical protein